MCKNDIDNMYLVVIHLGYINHVASLYNVSLCCVVSLNIIIVAIWQFN